MILSNPGVLVHKTRQAPTITAVVPASQSVDPSGQVTGSFGGGQTILIFSKNEDIVYTRKPKGQRNVANRCVHLKLTEGYAGGANLSPIRVENLSLPGYWTRYYNGHQHQQVAHALAVTAAQNAFPGSFGSAYLTVNGQTFINDSWAKTKPDLTVTSLPNFLIELGEVDKLAKNWLTRKGRKSQVRQARRQRLSKTLAGGVLEESFAWAPLIGDVRSMIDSLKNTQRRIADFEAMIGKPVKARRVVVSETQEQSGIFNYEGDSKQPCSWRATLYQRVTAHFTFVGRAPKAMSDLEHGIRGALDSLGFELNPRIIWDALPGSFLVDYFVSVGKALETFKIDTFELPVDIVDSYLQCTEEMAITSNLTLDKGSAVSSVNHWPTHATMYRRFERFPIAPTYDFLRALDVKLPSTRQASMIFALVAANLGGSGVNRITRSNIPNTKTISAIPFGNLSDSLLIR